MRIALDEDAAKELMAMAGGGKPCAIPSRVLTQELAVPAFIVTNDPDGSVFIGGTKGDLPLIRITPSDRQEIATAILSAVIDGMVHADTAAGSGEAGGFQRTLLLLPKLPGTRDYNITALHYVLMTDITDEVLSIAAGRPISRATNALATVVI